MSRHISLNFEAVYTKKATLKDRLEAVVAQMEDGYLHVLRTLESSLDGEAASALKKTIEANKEKVYIAKETVEKQLSFMENSSKMVEALDLDIEKNIKASRIDTYGW